NATLTVTPYATGPNLVSAAAVQNGATLQVGVKFNQFLDPVTSANAANYTLAHGSVSSASYDATTLGGVILTVTGLTVGQANSVTVSNVRNDDKDRKSTRLNSSHVKISYAVFCLKKKN